jgi:hypothetical protein
MGSLDQLIGGSFTPDSETPTSETGAIISGPPKKLGAQIDALVVQPEWYRIANNRDSYCVRIQGVLAACAKATTKYKIRCSFQLARHGNQGCTPYNHYIGG